MNRNIEILNQISKNNEEILDGVLNLKNELASLRSRNERLIKVLKDTRDIIHQHNLNNSMNGLLPTISLDVIEQALKENIIS